MTDEIDRQREWTNVNQVMELVKQEGDAACERAFDFLLAEVRRERDAGMEQRFAHRPHKPESPGSTPGPATTHSCWIVLLADVIVLTLLAALVLVVEHALWPLLRKLFDSMFTTLP